MEKKIIEALDNLTIEQTEKLLNQNMKMKMSNEEHRRIKKLVSVKIDARKSNGFYMPKKFAAAIVLCMVMGLTVSVVGLDKVTAAIARIFTFIPGDSIVERSNEIVYTMKPVHEQMKTEDGKATAVITRASYVNQRLTATISVYGEGIGSMIDKRVIIYINQKEIKTEPTTYHASDAVLYDLICETTMPSPDDLYKVEIPGFDEQLSFRLVPCDDYEDISQIGPTDVQNDISVTVTANRIGEQLNVWCYPFYETNTVKDQIVGYGRLSEGSWEKSVYLQIDDEKIYPNTDGWQIQERLVFNLPKRADTVVLHMPFLSMLHDEKKKFSIPLVESSATDKSNFTVKCSLGTIGITEIDRRSNPANQYEDIVRIGWIFNSDNEKKVLSSIHFNHIDDEKPKEVRKYNEKTGCLAYSEFIVEKDAREMPVELSGVTYYLLGEYVIPMDVNHTSP